MNNDNMIIAENIVRAFPIPGGEFLALKGVSADIPRGSFTILKGRSGSGKTTFMNIINTLDNPTSGTVVFDGKDVGKLSEKKREILRRQKMGFVFQSVSLIPSLNAMENVEFSMRMAGIKIDAKARRDVEECLNKVGLHNRMTHYPAEMSGGEQQRVAIARALAHKPLMIFADEPTAELDSSMAAKVTQIFREMAKQEGITVLMTTHDVGLMGAADNIIELSGGERVYEE